MQELVLCCCEVHFCAVVGPFAQLLMLREDRRHAGSEAAVCASHQFFI